MSAETERKTSARPKRESRHRAREAALQMLYQWEVGRQPMPDVVNSYWTSGLAADAAPADSIREFATRMAQGVADSAAELDPMIAQAAEHWRIERMAVMDRNILRLAVYEFVRQPDTPAKVVINEALELARTFCADDSVRFINGILDGIRRSLGRE